MSPYPDPTVSTAIFVFLPPTSIFLRFNSPARTLLFFSMMPHGCICLRSCPPDAKTGVPFSPRIVVCSPVVSLTSPSFAHFLCPPTRPLVPVTGQLQHIRFVVHAGDSSPLCMSSSVSSQTWFFCRFERQPVNCGEFFVELTLFSRRTVPPHFPCDFDPAFFRPVCAPGYC